MRHSNFRRRLIAISVPRPPGRDGGSLWCKHVAERCSGQCKACRRAPILIWLGMAYWGYQDDCAVLQVNAPEAFTEASLSKAFRRLAKEVHPDKNQDGAEAFKRLSAARDRLVGSIQPSPPPPLAPPAPPPPSPPAAEAAASALKAAPCTTKASPETRAASQATKGALRARQASPPPSAPCGAFHRLVKRDTEGNPTCMYFSAAMAGCFHCVRYWLETMRMPHDAQLDNHGNTAIDYIVWSQQETARLGARRPDTTEVAAYLRELAGGA